MEPDIRQFLRNILQTLSVISIWMMINIYFGLSWRLVVFEREHATGTIVFYIWMAVTSFLMLKYLKKLWAGSLKSKDIT